MKEINISKHKLVPKHTILKEEEKRTLLEKHKINLNQLPRILTSDPMIVQLGANVGDVIKIERKSSTSGETTYYRVVIKGTFK